MKYLLTFNRDNGERCHCHRVEWTETVEEEWSGEKADYTPEDLAGLERLMVERNPTAVSIYRVDAQLK